MDRLPIEILHIILSNITHIADYKSAALVLRRWWRVLRGMKDRIAAENTYLKIKYLTYPTDIFSTWSDKDISWTYEHLKCGLRHGTELIHVTPFEATLLERHWYFGQLHGESIRWQITAGHQTIYIDEKYKIHIRTLPDYMPLNRQPIHIINYHDGVRHGGEIKFTLEGDIIYERTWKRGDLVESI